MVVKSGVSMQTANTGPARPDMIAGAHNFQRSSRRLICATTRPPTSVPAMPSEALEGAGIGADLGAAEMMHAGEERRDPRRGGVIGVGREPKSDQHDDEARLRREKAQVGPIGSGMKVSAIAPRLGSEIVSHRTAASAMPGRPAVKNAMRQP